MNPTMRFFYEYDLLHSYLIRMSDFCAEAECS